MAGKIESAQEARNVQFEAVQLAERILRACEDAVNGGLPKAAQAPVDIDTAAGLAERVLALNAWAVEVEDGD